MIPGLRTFGGGEYGARTLTEEIRYQNNAEWLNVHYQDGEIILVTPTGEKLNIGFGDSDGQVIEEMELIVDGEELLDFLAENRVVVDPDGVGQLGNGSGKNYRTGLLYIENNQNLEDELREVVAGATATDPATIKANLQGGQGSALLIGAINRVREGQIDVEENAIIAEVGTPLLKFGDQHINTQDGEHITAWEDYGHKLDIVESAADENILGAISSKSNPIGAIAYNFNQGNIDYDSLKGIVNPVRKNNDYRGVIDFIRKHSELRSDRGLADINRAILNSKVALFLRLYEPGEIQLQAAEGGINDGMDLQGAFSTPRVTAGGFAKVSHEEAMSHDSVYEANDYGAAKAAGAASLYTTLFEGSYAQMNGVVSHVYTPNQPSQQMGEAVIQAIQEETALPRRNIAVIGINNMDPNWLPAGEIDDAAYVWSHVGADSMKPGYEAIEEDWERVMQYA